VETMTERFLEDVRSSIERYSRATERIALDRDERLLKEIHHLCCLIADKDNGTGIAPLREIAGKFATFREEASDEITAAIYDFGCGFALLRARLARSRKQFLSSRKYRKAAASAC